MAATSDKFSIKYLSKFRKLIYVAVFKACKPTKVFFSAFTVLLQLN